MEVDRLAVGYGFDKISYKAVDAKILKKVIRKFHDREVWIDCFQSNIIEVRPYMCLDNKHHYS